MAIKEVKSHPVNGPYNSTRYTSSAKAGKNGTYTWTTQAEEYDYNNGVHTWDIYNLPEGRPTIGETVKIARNKKV
jgi:outer membrane protease|tara:strand:- start:184 stop:408 length:225 start_codon:yes stop_codon:yes gene_type:complete